MLAPLLYAQFENKLVRKHAIGGGVDFAKSWGTLDNFSKYFLIYHAELKVFLNQHSINLSGGYGEPNSEYDYMGFLCSNVEYQYNFFWPEPFRIGAGAGFGFHRLEYDDVLITGNGANLVLSAQYYFADYFAVEGAIRYRLIKFNKMAEGENSALVHKLIEKFGYEHEVAAQLSNVAFQDDYGSLSAKAIKKILPHLKDGNKYDVACEYAGYRHSASSLTKEEIENKILKDRLDAR